MITFKKFQLVKKMITQLVLSNYLYFKEHYKMIAIDLSRQKALDPDTEAIQEIYFTGNLRRAERATMLVIIEEAKETVLDF